MLDCFHNDVNKIFDEESFAGSLKGRKEILKMLSFELIAFRPDDLEKIYSC